MWYVYFLELSNNDIYVGSTNDLKRRFHSHQLGHVVSTKAYLPVVLKSYVAVETEGCARNLEDYFKSGSGKAFANKRFFGENQTFPLKNQPHLCSYRIYPTQYPIKVD